MTMPDPSKLSRPQDTKTDFRTLLDGLGQGILLFDGRGKLVTENVAARHVLGANMPVVRQLGWQAISELFDSRRTGSYSVDEARQKAIQSGEPVRFSALLAGAYISCNASPMRGTSQNYTLLTLDRPDWNALTELMNIFRAEAGEAINSTHGHADIIMKLIRNPPKNMTLDQLGERVNGFAGAIATQMQRMNQLMAVLYRLELVRTNQIGMILRENRRKVTLDEFIEDYLEEITDAGVIDPTHSDDFRSRLLVEVPPRLFLAVAPSHLRTILTDLLRNAFMYSPKVGQVMVRAHLTQQGSAVQIDVIDEGCGVRPSEAEKVFMPFQRSRQPQVIAEFGYGISLYLVKAELEAMGGRIWYASEEGVGTAMSLKLPSWVDAGATSEDPAPAMPAQ